MKLLKDNIREKLDDLGCGDDFLEKKGKKLDFIKINNFCSAKDTAKKIKSHSLEENLCKRHLIKDCYPKYTKNFKMQPY